MTRISYQARRYGIKKLLADLRHGAVYDEMKKAVRDDGFFLTTTILARAGVVVDTETIRWDPLVRHLQDELGLVMIKMRAPRSIRRRRQLVLISSNTGGLELAHGRAALRKGLIVGWTSSGNVLAGMVIEQSIKTRRNIGNGLLRSAANIETNYHAAQAAQNVLPLPSQEEDPAA